jgi:GNAT superfamily N-acetyltransferase
MASIRPATREDAEAIARVHVQAWREAYRGILPPDVLDRLSVQERMRLWDWALSHKGGGAMFVAEDKGRVVGFICAGRPREPRLGGTEIQAIYVLATNQGKGLGRGLMRAAMQALCEAQDSTVYLWVANRNSKARRFYDKLGGVAGETKDAGRLVEVVYRWPSARRLFSGS